MIFLNFLAISKSNVIISIKLLQAELALKETQQVSITERNKFMMQEQLLHEVTGTHL